ncbi:MAG: hypothetical protein M3Q47_15295 [Actinomycetota bacterium]|nr:hypothetical protein [Actinomycetota bacterium]
MDTHPRDVRAAVLLEAFVQRVQFDAVLASPGVGRPAGVVATLRGDDRVDVVEQGLQLGSVERHQRGARGLLGGQVGVLELLAPGLPVLRCHTDSIGGTGVDWTPVDPQRR